LEVIFLGTGTSQGVPVIACECDVCKSTDIFDKRLRTSALVKIQDNYFVIDCGPDFRQQMLYNKVKKLDAILFTHEHKDHIAGLDDVRSFNWIYKKPVEVYAEERVLNALKNEYAYAFSEFKYPGIPEINLNKIDSSIFKINDIEIVPIRGYHLNLPVLGFRISNFAYLTDVNKVEDEEINKIKNIDTLVVNALRIKKHLSHFNLEDALNFIIKVNPKKAYLTHISHYMGFHKKVEKILPKNVFLAYDNLTINILD